ncbi:hypothetical protein [Candidatus Magnetominusculus xianensis]|nr:hypothetical protein [Candidatus Magnetominusculus xianensis]MBF0402810.1 hypothetical protein [Nitrospirota bacterium]
MKKLICGRYSPHEELNHKDNLYEILSHIGNNIEFFTNKSFHYIEMTDRDITNIGPYCGRALMEASFTGLAARIDPFKLLFIRYKQLDPKYMIDKKNKFSIQWSGDIISPTKEEDTELEKNPRRPLLSPTMYELVWKPAIVKCIEYIQVKEIQSDWIQDTFFTVPEGPIDKQADSVYGQFLTNTMNLYSFLSKGVHQEFVVSPESLYDSDTVKLKLSDLIKLISLISLISHNIPIAIGNMNMEETIGYFQKIEKRRQKIEERRQN